VVFFGISALFSIQAEWFHFVQDLPGRDKLLHCLGAGLLSIVIITGFSAFVVRRPVWGPLSVLAAIALLIRLEECGQPAIPARTFDLTDLGWSCARIALFRLPAMCFRRIQEAAR